MIWTVFKVAMTTTIIMAIPHLSKVSTLASSLLAAIPIVSVLAMIWMYLEGQDLVKIGEFSRSVFFMVLPSLPMFLILPKLFERFHFVLSLTLACLLTAILYLFMLRFVKF